MITDSSDQEWSMVQILIDMYLLSRITHIRTAKHKKKSKKCTCDHNMQINQQHDNFNNS